MKLLPNWLVKMTDYLDDVDMNDSFKEYKSVEHIQETWHHKKD